MFTFLCISVCRVRSRSIEGFNFGPLFNYVWFENESFVMKFEAFF